jgi:hypothetical protein
MDLLRFRIRTIMILGALIAVLTGGIAASGFVGRIRDASVRFEPVPESPAYHGSGTITFSHRSYVQIPLMSLLLPATIGTAPIVPAIDLSARRRSRAETRRSPDAS